MKKLIALIMAAMMLFTAAGALAEAAGTAPLYATLGEAMEDSMDGRVVAGGIPGEYYAVVTQKDGIYYRSVAYYDEKMKELEEATGSLNYEDEDFSEKHEAALTAEEEYRKTLPIAYSEAFTAVPLSEEEMASRSGKTLGELTGEGFEIGDNGTEAGEAEDEMIIVYTLRYGVFDYRCVIDGDFDQLIEAKEQDGEDGLTVKSMSLIGITSWGFDKRFHTDGTVDEPEDPFAVFSEVLTEMMSLMEKAQADETFDIDASVETLKTKYPDYADMIDMYLTLYQTYGIEGLSRIMTPAE